MTNTASTAYPLRGPRTVHGKKPLNVTWVVPRMDLAVSLIEETWARGFIAEVAMVAKTDQGDLRVTAAVWVEGEDVEGYAGHLLQGIEDKMAQHLNGRLVPEFSVVWEVSVYE